MVDIDLNEWYLELFCQSPLVRLVLITSDDEGLKFNRVEINCTGHDGLSKKIRQLCINHGTISNNYVWDGKKQIQSQFRIVDLFESSETEKILKSIIGIDYDSFARRAINAAWSEVRVDFLLKYRHELPAVVAPCKNTLSTLGINLMDDPSALIYLSTSDRYFVGNSLLRQISLFIINSDIERLSIICCDVTDGGYPKKLRDIT
jgi:hypothetical protein